MKILLRTTNVFVESLSYRMVNIESNDDEDEDDDNFNNIGNNAYNDNDNEIMIFL